MLGLFILPLIAAVVSIGLGFVWYHVLFVKQFAMMMGTNPEMVESKKSQFIKIGIELVLNYIVFLGFLLIMSVFQAVVIKSAIIFSAIFWLVIVAPMKASEALWSGKGTMNSLKIFLVKGAFSLISFEVASILFVILVKLFA